MRGRALGLALVLVLAGAAPGLACSCRCDGASCVAWSATADSCTCISTTELQRQCLQVAARVIAQPPPRPVFLDGGFHHAPETEAEVKQLARWFRRMARYRRDTEEFQRCSAVLQAGAGGAAR